MYVLRHLERRERSLRVTCFEWEVGDLDNEGEIDLDTLRENRTIIIIRNFTK